MVDPAPRGAPAGVAGGELRRPAAASRVAELLPRYADDAAGLAADPDGAASAVLDTATGTVLTEVVDTPASGVRAALAAAARAQTTSWLHLTGADRTRHLLALAEALRTDVRAMGATASLTTGVPVRQAAAAAEHLADSAFSTAGWADKLGWTPLPAATVGVVALVVDWRTSPTALDVSAVAALACGNAVALRPRPQAAPLAH
ncbi:aldehyde dehydrogenase family protein, partial [Kineococcus glutinatus]|uniref:aldehyde dehydrogenase family protein n=1 Tax=Kineococcus glutinatus TaxID=1070872 RepID=UPI0031EE4BFD